jgi:hypothetical protein
METQQRTTDAVLQDELIRNERIVKHPKFGTIKLSRPTPRKERLIAEVRRQQYHKDLQDASILAKSQLEQIAIQRGMWSEDKTLRLSNLSHRVGEIMGILDTVGYQSVEKVVDEYYALVGKLAEQFESQELKDTVVAYFNLDSPSDKKLKVKLMKEATSSNVDDMLSEGDLMRDQIDLLHEMAKTRKELNELQVQHTRLFVDSIESRADRAEELAQLYYCISDMDGKHLWPSFDEIMDQPPEEIEFLMTEMFYFINGITEEFKAILGKHGFVKRQTTTVEASDDSPDLPPISLDGESQESEQVSSSE